jgi:uncharacterized protein YjbI with pentapeptide repeats
MVIEIKDFTGRVLITHQSANLQNADIHGANLYGADLGLKGATALKQVIQMKGLF